MKREREPKKSETLEVRLPHEVKTALMRKAQSEGRSASEVVRQSIGAYLAEQSKEARSMTLTAWKMAATASVGAAAFLWLAVGSTPATAGPDFRIIFEQLDRNRDGALTVDEFLVRSPDTLYVARKDDVAEAQLGATPKMIPLGRALPAPPPDRSQPPQAMLRSEFAKHDRDRNGAVTFAEFEAQHKAMFEAGFAAVDKNGDGSLDRGEYRAVVASGPKGAPAAAGFHQIDENGDGRITAEEFFN